MRLHQATRQVEGRQKSSGSGPIKSDPRSALSRHSHSSRHRSESPYVPVTEHAIPWTHIAFKLHATSPHCFITNYTLKEGGAEISGTLRHQARRDNNSNATLWPITPFTEVRLIAVHLRDAYAGYSNSLSCCLDYVADVPDGRREWVKVVGK
jgi:hypothetical protein